MIPKIIHYCWFGGNPLPDMANKCIESWKKYCPDFEIKEWNESNFPIEGCDYLEEAYKAKKWAFVSDYARFKILYENGGLYFDTDVELIKPIDDIVEQGSFMGMEKALGKKENAANPGLGLAAAPGLGLAAAPGLGLYKELLDFYHTIHFIREDGSYDLTTVVDYTTTILVKYGFRTNRNVLQQVAGINIYPKDYFGPMDMDSGELIITDNTRSIHHYAGSWASESVQYGYHLKWKYIEKYGKAGKVLYKIPYSIYIIRHDGIKSLFKKVGDKISRK